MTDIPRPLGRHGSAEGDPPRATVLSDRQASR
jgi:hypothetical protein